MNCVVTGGSGFVGQALVRRLLKDNCEVRVLDPYPSTIPGVRWVRGDVRHRQLVLDTCTGCDVIFHLAAMVPITRAGPDFWSVNVLGTQTVAEVAADLAVRRLVYLSSSAVYGVPQGCPIDEDTPVNPLGAYGHSKWNGELATQRARERGVRVAIIRPRTVVGPGRRGIFDLLFGWVQRDLPIFIPGSGAQKIQLIANDDLADAMVAAAQTDYQGVINAGTDEFQSLRADLNAFAQAVGSKSRVRRLPALPVKLTLQALDVLRLSPLVDWHYRTIEHSYWFSTDRAQRVLGWIPKHSNVAMLLEAYRDFVSNRLREGTDVSPHRRGVQKGMLAALDYLARRESEYRARPT